MRGGGGGAYFEQGCEGGNEGGGFYIGNRKGSHSARPCLDQD